MSKRSTTPLYELIRSRSGERVSGTRDRETPVSPDVTVGNWLKPGRFVQIPVGYVFIAGAAVLVVVALGYMLGYSRGHDAARLVLEEDLAPTQQVSDAAGRPRDPLLAGTTSTAGESRSGSGRDTVRTQRPLALPGTSDGQGLWGAIESDPREPGFNYFVLAETRLDGALRLAEFCRERGLETYVVSSNNPRRRLVIALPGFEPGQRTSAQTRAVEDHIHRIGQSWKDTEPGATDLRDAYPVRYGN